MVINYEIKAQLLNNRLIHNDNLSASALSMNQLNTCDSEFVAGLTQILYYNSALVISAFSSAYADKSS